MTSRILLIQLRQSGDVLMTTAATREIRKAYPGAHISFLTEPPSDQIYRHNPYVSEVILWRRWDSVLQRLRAGLGLRRARFDLVVDFFCNPQSALITLITGAPRRVGFALRGRAWVYTQSLPMAGLPAYSGGHKMALARLLGVAPADPTPEVFLAGEARRYATAQLTQVGVGAKDLLVVLSPVSRRDFRRWPLEKYAHLADMLIQRYGAKVLLQYGPGEQETADALRALMREQALPDFPMPNLMQMAALLERADLFVGNNNGPRHFAVALGTPTVGIFGRAFPELWTPPGLPGRPSGHQTVQHDPGCKTACHYPRCERECIRDVPYHEVEAVVVGLMEGITKNGGIVSDATSD